MATPQTTSVPASNKVCTKCGESLPATAEHFQDRKGAPDGLRSYCRTCMRKCNQEKYKSDPEKYKAYTRKQQAQPDYNEQQRGWRRARIAEKLEWERANRDKRREKIREEDKRYKNSLTGVRKTIYHLRSSIGTLIRRNRRGQKAGRKIEELTGWKVAELITHLESLFVDGMTWENYGNKPGQWSIDHIRPISSFAVGELGDAEFRTCWALSNLRPLWHIENVRKGDRWAS